MMRWPWVLLALVACDDGCDADEDDGSGGAPAAGAGGTQGGAGHGGTATGAVHGGSGGTPSGVAGGGTGGTAGDGGGAGAGGTATGHGGEGGGFGGIGGLGGAMGPGDVPLGSAESFAILAKSGIDTVPASAIVGHVGTSPIDSTALTGFSLILDASGEFSTSTQVTGRLFAADYAPPTPALLTVAVLDMQAAYTDAAGRPGPDFTELAGGDLSGLVLVPGLYKWGTGVLMSTNVVLNGGPDDTWIMQIAGGITMASGAATVLAGGALARHIVWQSFGAVAIGTGAHLEGVVLSSTEITLATGATVNGRLLSQTAVTLDMATITEPPP